VSEAIMTKMLHKEEPRVRVVDYTSIRVEGSPRFPGAAYNRLDR
jgi:hypothetical protein